MNPRYLLSWMLLPMAGVAFAVELPMDLGTFRTLDNKVYEETKVVSSDAVGIRISHAGGSARIPFERLPRDLAAKFKVDPEAAAAQRQREQAEMVAHEEATEEALREQKAEAEKPEPAVVKEDDEGEEPPAVVIEELRSMNDRESAVDRMLFLQRYIQRTTLQIQELERDVEKRTTRAKVVAGRAYFNAGGQQVNKGSIRRADFIYRGAHKQAQDKRRLEDMVKLAKEEIRLLNLAR